MHDYDRETSGGNIVRKLVIYSLPPSFAIPSSRGMCERQAGTPANAVVFPNLPGIPRFRPPNVLHKSGGVIPAGCGHPTPALADFLNHRIPLNHSHSSPH